MWKRVIFLSLLVFCLGMVLAGCNIVISGMPVISGPEIIPGGPGEPNLVFTYVPPYGTWGDLLRGRVMHVRPSDYRVAVYIKVGNGWWTKPYWAWPLTKIMPDGRWSCNITTGGIDHRAREITAFLVPAGYNPPLMRGGRNLPTELDQVSVARVSVARL